MVDSIQILLTVVVSVLTVLLTIIGIAIFQILKEFKKSIEKINYILDDTHRISSAVAEPVEDASELLKGFKSGIALIKTAAGILKEDKQKQPEIKDNLVEENSEMSDHGYDREQSKRKNFFSKAGKILKKPL